MQPPEGRFQQVSAGGEQTCALDMDQAIHCWGADFDGSTQPPKGRYQQISAGWGFGCAVSTEGVPVCWGGAAADFPSPPQGEYRSIVAGYLHACGILVDGSVRCWGQDADLENTPTEVVLTLLVLGEMHACGLETAGTVSCWGRRSEATDPPTDPSYEVRPSPNVEVGPKVTIPEDLAFVDITAGYRHLCGLTAEGAIYCWGHSAVGESSPPPGRFIGVDAGLYHTCGVRSDSTITCWGWNDYHHDPSVQATTDGSTPPGDDHARYLRTCPYEGLGLLYLRQGRTERAKRNLEKAIELAPDIEIHKYTGLAAIYLDEGRLDDARDLIEKAEANNPEPRPTEKILALRARLEQLESDP